MQTPTDSRKDARHTPGPWAAYRDQNRWRICGEDNVAFVSLSTRDHDEAAPDAHLIAAAPELLAALEEVKTWIRNWDPNFTADEEWSETQAKVDAAIAKAKGGAR